MPVKIFDVVRGSVCDKKRIRPGDTLVSINGNEINDVLDYRFFADDYKLKIEYINSSGRVKHTGVKGISGCDDLGLEFETYLMDKHRHCANHCVFCFIDQLPRGMRGSLYFKDDDSRLSFLFGNYITLTNLTEHDVERIIKMHIDPLNISVHTMNPELRVKMMRNPRAGEVLSLLRRFSDAGISINTQLVLCPGLNDGEELDRSLNELSKLDGVRSIAAVPVGLTKYRDGLYPLKKYSACEASDVIDRIDAFNAELMRCGREKLAFPSDEFFQLADREIPGGEYYSDYPQLDNGVGLLRLTCDEFFARLDEVSADEKERRFALATGAAAYPLMRQLADGFMRKFVCSRVDVYEIKNLFFGEDVTVAGLITGRDLIAQLRQSGFGGGTLLLPEVMLRSSDDRVFLDDVTLAEAAKDLNADICITSCDGALLCDAFLRQ